MQNQEQWEIEPGTEQTPKSNGNGKLIAIALCCALMGGGIGALGTVAGMHALDTKGQSSTAENTGNSNAETSTGQEESKAPVQTVVRDDGELMTAAEVYAANVNSTVGIQTEIETNYFGYQTMAAASGSGFILNTDGYILTNYHVIEDASKISVTAYDGTTYEAKLVGGDKSNDIAVLQIEAENLQPVTLGSSDDLMVGEEVIAIGNPLGELTFSLTKGVVSALDREVTFTTGTMNLIQTDCAINSGNSGGALFNMKGEVVGITNAKYSSNSSSEASIDNIGFAIPIDHAMTLVESIIENGYVVKPYLGISVTDVSSELTGYGLPEGAIIKAVTEDSPAAKAGLQVNDIVTAVNGEAITSSSQLVMKVQTSEVGATLKLDVYRSGDTMTIEVTLEENKQTTDDSQQQQQDDSGNNFPWWDYSPFG